eukprot:4687489-Prymnesium_polylepis.1
MCKLHKSIKILSKALDNIADDSPHLDMGEYLEVEHLNSEIDVDDFMDDIQDLVPSDYEEED